jgi:hydrogenase maturation protease
MPDLREQVGQCFQGCVCLVGIGNRDYGDDGFGLFLADALIERVNKFGKTCRAHRVMCAGTMPERVIDVVQKNRFDHLIFLDAIEFGGAPGSAVLLTAGEMVARFPQISTHKISIGLLSALIEEHGTTKAWLLGVQPASLTRSQGLTLTMQKTLEALAELICGVWDSRKGAADGSQFPHEQQVGLYTTKVNV